MKSLKAKAVRSTLFAASAIGLVGSGVGGAYAQQQPDIPKGWFKACTKREDVDICNVQNIIVSNSGQFVTGVSLIEVKGKTNQRLFQVTVPSGRSIRPGVGVKVDDGKTVKLDYAVCMPDRCIAQAPLSDDLVKTFKGGGSLTLISVNFQQQQNPLEMTLQGFTDAYDGDPISQSDMEQRQKQLQEYVQKNNEGFAKKLEEEQEKIKNQSE